MRLETQARTLLSVLPRGSDESTEAFEERLGCLAMAGVRWQKLNGVTAPLVLPRGRHESDEIFTKRLALATSPTLDGVCLVLLPQSEGEGDEAAAKRLILQARLKMKAFIHPYAPRVESMDQFRKRLTEHERSDGMGVLFRVQITAERLSRARTRMSSRLGQASTRVSGRLSVASSRLSRALSSTLSRCNHLHLLHPHDD